jgi:hypothetical protein
MTLKDRSVCQVPVLNVVNMGDVVPCIPSGLFTIPNGLSDHENKWVRRASNVPLGILSLRKSNYKN